MTNTSGTNLFQIIETNITQFPVRDYRALVVPWTVNVSLRAGWTLLAGFSTLLTVPTRLMEIFRHALIPVLWVGWAAYWIFSAKRVEPAKKVELSSARVIHLALVWLAIIFAILPVFNRGVLGWRFVPGSDPIFLLGTAIVAAGLAFASWARIHLGRYWSGAITLKEGHRLIRTGPYGLVRHPIYTGLLAGLFGTSVALGEFRALIALLFVVMVYSLKSRREEARLVNEFGEEYLRYRREVNALVPLPRFVQQHFWKAATICLLLLAVTAYAGRGVLEQIATMYEIHRLRLFTPVAVAGRPAPGIRSEVQFVRDLGEFHERLVRNARKYSSEFKPMVEEIDRRQTAGRNASYSVQIYRELRWLINFTSHDDVIRKRLGELKASLASDADQSFALEQQPDGSWGPGYTAWFMKLYGTVQEGLTQGGKVKYPLTFLNRINSPEKLTNHLYSVITDDFLKSGTFNRMEADETTSVLARLILGDTQTDYPFHPQLKDAFMKFLDDWQNPETGCWGIWFVGRDGTTWRMDDVGMTFHMVARTKERTKHLDLISRRVLQLSTFDFPMGIRMDGKYENHLNWDVVTILRYAWPKLDEPTRREAQMEISRMLDWSLRESLQSDGSFKTSALDDTFGDAMEFGVYFLFDTGFLEKKRRFWTGQDFPQAEEIRNRIRARLEASGLKSPELKSAYQKLVEVD